MNNLIYFFAYIIFALTQSCSGNSIEDKQDITNIETEDLTEIDEFYSLTTDSIGVFKIPFDNNIYHLDEAVNEISPIYFLKKDTLYYRNSLTGIKKNHKMKFPLDFHVEDTALALIFSGRKHTITPDYLAVLIGNYKKNPTIIVDTNYNLDFSDDAVFNLNDRGEKIYFDVKQSEFGVVVKYELNVIDWTKETDRKDLENIFSRYSSLVHSKIHSDYWLEVTRNVNFKKLKILVNEDSALLALLDGSNDGLYDDKRFDRILVVNHNTSKFPWEIWDETFSPKKEGFFIEIGENAFEVVEIEPTGAYIKIKEAPKKHLASRLKEGAVVPDFSFTTFSGSSQNLYSLTSKNNYTLLQFWGTWCKPCVENIPKLMNIESKYKNFSVVGFNAYDSNEKALNFIKKKNIIWTNGFASEEILDIFDVKSFPTYILLSADNKVLKRINSLNELDLFLQEK